MKVAPKPYIYSRAQWGANERMRDQSPPSYGTVKAGFIHHTVNANSYTSAQVPALLRGIYAYHTQSRGWRDIGYNYLVDRFGRIWEGRYGGVSRAGRRSPHAGLQRGLLRDVGDRQLRHRQAAAAVVSAYARLFAWKLSLYNIRGQQPAGLREEPLPAGDQRPPRRRADRLPGPLPLRAAALRSGPGPEIQIAAQTGTGDTAAHRRRAPPTPFTSPTQTPRPPPRSRAASPSRRPPTWPARLPRPGAEVARNGAIRVLPTGGQTGLPAPVVHQRVLVGHEPARRRR